MTEANEGVEGLRQEEAREEVKVFRGSGIHLLVEGVGDDLATVWLQSTSGTAKEVGGVVGRGDRGGAGNVHNER